MPTCPFCYQVVELTRSGLQPPCSLLATEAHCDACTKLAELDAKIAEARQSLFNMQAHRLQILSDVNGAHDLLRKRFPIEIFSNIFRQCLPDLETLNESNDRRLASTPLCLSQVCRQWRTISHSIPSLWNVMALYVEESRLFSVQGIFEVVREWIGRSGHHLPLHVILKVEPEADWEGSLEKYLFKAIPNHKQRLGYLQVEASITALLRLQNLGEDLPPPSKLQLASILSYIAYPSTDYPGIPRLKRNLLDNIEVSLNNLTHVDTTTIWLGDIIAFLRHAPNLVSLKSNAVDKIDWGYQEETSLPMPPLTLQTLEEFHIGSEGRETCDLIFHGFNFLSLKSLVVNNESAESSDESDWRELFVALADHSRRSGSHLQSMSIYRITIEFDSSGDYPWFTEVFGSIGSSLNHLDVSPLDVESGDDHRLASAIGATLNRLPSLCSITLYAGELHWIHALKSLLLASSEIIIPTGQQLSIKIWSSDLMLNKNTGRIRSHTLYYHDDECPLLNATDIRMILDIMNHELISTTITQHSTTFSADIEMAESEDITGKVIVDLGRILHQMEADGTN